MAVRLLRLPRPLRESPTPDGDLLTRFLDLADADAFAELVRRHAGMVRGVCRRALGPTDEADDAFQATFLVFVRKARTVSPRSQVGNFLYGVAYRTAAHARSARAVRAARHRELPDMPAVIPHAADPDQLAALDEELARLPDGYRAAVVLCELEGLSLKDAAARMKVPAGTLASRLARGRRLLADRLTRRGLAGLLVSLGGAAAASVPRTLIDRALAGATAPAAELAHGVLKAMLISKLKTLGKAAAGAALLGAVLLAPVSGHAAPAPEPVPKARPAAAAEGKDRQKLEELWQRLGAIGLNGPRLQASATLELAKQPGVVPFLKEKLTPIKADRDEMRQWLTDLSSDQDEVWTAAYRKMAYLDPRLVYSLAEQFDIVPDDLGRSRLVGVWWQNPPDGVVVRPNLAIAAVQPDPNKVAFEAVRNLPGGGQERISFSQPNDGVKSVGKQQWDAAQRAVAVLEQIGTPDAVAVLKQLAAGHDDVLPTVEAKAALQRLGK